ncbi:hypothetical protein QIS99_05370 [Streptomyces sp. B-S-A8]|uniref:Uncharacterized protein n=1 Tax=Streptomyces solicavernae TaxID=3043614 RepID=A0ABT6RMJ9_9ACTN|nr:hypothetical protein [Streptomyces sp. B-S-A8]MDI3385649.1 hypothetical protein [Streptomyces sp. B-S-A8]
MPSQPGGPAGDGPPPALPVTPPGASEATRLLCAGSYLDEAYRQAVIDELYVHEERIVAPSLGFDAARVLAHAMRARLLELSWAAGILFLWVIGTVLSSYLMLVLVVPSLTLFFAARLRGEDPRASLWRRVPALLMRWSGRILVLVTLLVLLAVGIGESDGASIGSIVSLTLPGPLSDVVALLESSGGTVAEPFHGWAVLATLVLVALCVAAQRGQFARALAGELHPGNFGDMAADPAERAGGPRFQRLRTRIRIEQHAPLVMYHSAHPFCGAGEPYDAWTLAVELRPDPGKEQRPLGNRVILDAVRPLFDDLRVPAPHAEGRGRDRLRQLQIDECVFLPVDGLPRRDLAPYEAGAFEAHRDESVEEGGETRRHFLRIRVGGWEEEVVTTVFVRVHTQGGMLMLEVAPHVLLPVRKDFENADRLAHEFRHSSLFGKAMWALGHTPRSFVHAVVTLGRGVAYSWRAITGGYGKALPDGPAASVRELGSDGDSSLFQDMDVRRYLKSIQDRVANGVRTALRDAGYRTDEFAQKIVNVSGGGTLIENASGAFAVGDRNVITNQAAQPGSPGTGPEPGSPFTKSGGGPSGSE